jgi:hypothetical protein
VGGSLWGWAMRSPSPAARAMTFQILRSSFTSEGILRITFSSSLNCFRKFRIGHLKPFAKVLIGKFFCRPLKFFYFAKSELAGEACRLKPYVQFFLEFYRFWRLRKREQNLDN